MKKIMLACLVFSFLVGCGKTSTVEAIDNESVWDINHRSCASNDVLQAQLAADPSLRIRMENIESFTDNAIRTGLQKKLVNGVIQIPVVVNVLYKTAAENISQQQIQSQIDVLNADYNNTNSDRNKVPAVFSSSVGNVGVRFVLSAVNRKATSKKSWGANDAMKKAQQGGINPTDPAHNLNMWSCNLGQGLLGYAQF